MKLKMKRLVAIVLAAAGCSGCPSPDSPLRPVQPTDTSSCGEACDHLKVLGCPESKGSTPSDPQSCRKDCEYVQNHGLSIRPSCWISIKECKELETVCK